MEVNFGIIYKVESSSSPLWLARLFQYHLLIDAPSIIYYYLFFSGLFCSVYSNTNASLLLFSRKVTAVCLNKKHMLDSLLKWPQETLGWDEGLWKWDLVGYDADRKYRYHRLSILTLIVPVGSHTLLRASCGYSLQSSSGICVHCISEKLISLNSIWLLSFLMHPPNNFHRKLWGGRNTNLAHPGLWEERQVVRAQRMWHWEAS